MGSRKITSVVLAAMMAVTCFAGAGSSYAQTDEEAAKAALDEANIKVEEAQKAYDEAGLAYDNAGEQFIDAKAGPETTTDVLKEVFKQNSTLKKYVEDPAYDEALTSALTVENLNRAADLVDECNGLRAKHGKGALKINYRLMVLSASSVAVSSQYYGHVVINELYNGMSSSLKGIPPYPAENLAWGYCDPFDGWYKEEKQIFDKCVASGDYPGLETMNAYQVSSQYPDIYNQVGHYLNMIESYKLTGLATSSVTGCDGQVFSGDGDYGESVTTDEFRQALAEFTQPYQAARDAAKVDLDNAKRDRDAAQTAYDAFRTSITDAQITGITDSTYTGKAISKAIVVKVGDQTLEPSDYSVTYKNNTKVGLATVTIKGLGTYKDSVSKTFKILPKGTSISKLTAAKKGFNIKLKKQTTQTTGYQIRYSRKASMAASKTVKITKAKTVSKKIRKLKKKKKYYVQVRTYKTTGGKTYYSGWSAKKMIKTK